jgi:PAS domain S-box-containing protein
MFMDNEPSYSVQKSKSFIPSLELDNIKSVFNNSNYVFAIVSYNGKIKYLNPVLATILGVGHRHLLNRTAEHIVIEYAHPEDAKYTIQAHKEVKENNRICCFENRYRVKGGTYIWLSWMLIPSAQEKIFYTIAHNITEHRDLQDQMEKSELRIKNLFNNISDCFYALDEQWKVIYANKSAMEAFSRFCNQNILGKYYWDIFPDDKDDIYFLKFTEAFLTQKHIHFEAYSKVTNGWVRVNVYPSSDGISVYFRDISEQKKLAKFLDDERKRLYALLNGLPGLVYLRTVEGNVIFANQNFKNIHGEPDNRKCHMILFNRTEPCSYCQINSLSNTKNQNQWQCVTEVLHPSKPMFL